MKLRKNLLRKSQLYLILNRQNKSRRSLENICSDFSCGGIDLIQLRDKQSAKSDVLDLAIKLSKRLSSKPEGSGLDSDSQSHRPGGRGLASTSQSHKPEGRGLASTSQSHRPLFIINDYVDIALSCKADGVHLGQADTSIKEARKILGKDKIIGLSCHSLPQALKAQREGVDYIGIGPVYATPTKPEYKAIGLKTLRQLKDKIKIPYFAIGGIHQGNIKDIIASGASRIAVARAILKAKDPKEAARRLNKLLRKG